MTTKPDDDRAWDDLLERWELAGTDDPQALAEVEAALAAVEAAPPLTAERIAAAVEYVETEGAPPANVYALPRRLRWVKVATAVLLATMLTAAVSVGVIWWERARAHETMSCAMAVKILISNDQDALSGENALTRAFDCAVSAARVLRDLRLEEQAPQALLDFVELRKLDWLRALDIGAGVGMQVPENIEVLDTRARDITLTASERAHALDRLVGGAVTCIAAIQGYAPVDQNTAVVRASLLRTLRSSSRQLR